MPSPPIPNPVPPAPAQPSHALGLSPIAPAGSTSTASPSRSPGPRYQPTNPLSQLLAYLFTPDTGDLPSFVGTDSAYRILRADLRDPIATRRQDWGEVGRRLQEEAFRIECASLVANFPGSKLYIYPHSLMLDSRSTLLKCTFRFAMHACPWSTRRSSAFGFAQRCHPLAHPNSLARMQTTSSHCLRR